MKSLSVPRFRVLKRQTLHRSYKGFVTSLVSFLVPLTLLAAKPDRTAPSVPTGVVATAAGCGQVNISWQASTDTSSGPNSGSGIQQYNVYRNGSLLKTVLAPSTSTSDTTVAGATTYSYTVSATDNAGNTSSQSSAATVTTLSCGPTVPGNVSASAVSCSQVNVSWSASTDATATITRYNVYRNGVAFATVSAPNTSFSDTTVVASTTYNYTVSATDSAGSTSAQSTASGVTTPACADTTPPTVPTNVVATAVNCSTVNVSWSPSTDAGSGVKQYNVYRSASLIGIVAAPATSFVDNTVVASSAYGYTVSATDVAGNTSALSPHSSVVVPNCADTTPPTVPTGVTAAAASCSQVNVSWSASSDTGSGVKQYNVYRNGALVSTILAPTISFSDNTVAGSTSYNYTVSATDNSGNTSAQSTAASVATPACSTGPTVPGNVSASAANCSQINVSWSASSDSGSTIKQYNVYRNGALLTTVSAASTSFSDNSVAASTTYNYNVSATDNAGVTSAQSITASGTTPSCVDTTPPTVPTNVVATALSCTNVSLSWAASVDNGSGVRQYNIYRDGALINIVAAPATSALDTSVSASTAYSYTVSATDAGGNTSGLSASAPVTTPACGGACTVTVNVSASAGGTAGGGGTVNCGSSVTVNATANSCYQFVNWTVNGAAVSTLASYTFAPGASETIVANFAPTTYTISTSASPAGSGTVSGGGTVNCGSGVTVTASPAAGYVFTNWTENGTVVSTSASYAFTASANRNLVANFAVATCTDTIGTTASPAAAGGTSGGGTVSCGSSVTVTATPNSCYNFVNWTTANGAAVSTSRSYTFTANASQTLTANFTGITYTVSTSASAGGTASGGGTVSCGSSVTVTATPSSCYRFVNWTVNGTAVSTSASYNFVPSATETVTANFTPITYTISTTPSAGGTASGGGTVNCGSSVTVTATANSCYTFVNWTVNGTVVSTSANYTFTPTTSQTLTANFAQITYTVTPSSSPSAGGTTSGGGTVSCGNSVTVSASPAAGYTFSSWTQNGSVVSPSSSYTFTPSASGTLVANFTAATCTYSLSSSSASYASSGGTGSVTVTAGSSCSWTAASGANWITITAGASGTGNGTVSYSVAPNTSSSTLTGTMTIAGQTFTVTEAGVSAPGGQLTWLTNLTSTVQVIPAGTSVDSSNCTIVAGAFSMTANFGGGAVASAGGLDCFIAKYGSNGQYLWAKTFGSNGDDRIYSVTVDSQNNIIVTGYFELSVNFGGVTLTAPDPLNLGRYSIFVAKYSSSGTLIWAMQLGLPGDEGKAVAVDASNNIYLAANFSGIMNVGGLNLSSITGDYNVALAKFSPTGAALWARTCGSSSVDMPNDLAVDSSGNVLMTGSSSGASDFGGGAIGSGGAFIAKYSGATGGYLWAKASTATAGNAIVADPANGNVYVTGGFSGSVDFGGGAITTRWNGGIFIAGYSSSGAYLWSQAYGGSGDTGYAITADGSGHLAIADYNAGEILFPGTSTYSSGNFLISFTVSGTSAPVFQWAANNSVYTGQGIGYDSSGHVVTIGNQGNNGFVAQFTK